MSTRLAGVIGWPVAHSLSPRLHGFWLRSCGIDGAYVPLPVRREDFARVIEGLMKAGFAGVNVTVPHKEAAFALSSDLDAAAEAAGAVNLLIFGEGGRIEGRNTDIAGLRDSLVAELGPEALRGKIVVLLGAGGAARGAALALAELGAREIRIVNRTQSRAQALAQNLGGKTFAQLVPVLWSDWAKAASGAALLVNATSAGLEGKAPLDLPLAALPKDAAVCDLVYRPLRTALLEAAAARGHRVIDGLGMLMHQAAPSFAAFFGVTPEVTPALRAELEQALGHDC